ncbi:uncharacterized protein Dwil_GK14602 [Drosophila willistoni]|uniref:Lipase n=1 Tax=Drosophila willistoni TaxID=7260 RepID=B4MWR7_DROWI|nr:lipase 1 [Drosophila willistoni]EDW76556.2 uncharacterized protein Dwil_GK14602 [Drosophila willistoni]
MSSFTLALISLQPDLIKKYGYPSEIHNIETEDGFIITAHRIPKSGGQPVLLVHGIQDSSSTWVILGPSISLGYLLSHQGYDVWLLNTRGNRYSRKHKRYNRRQPQFWDFSFHEIGIYDLPAAIDYILQRSKGFSQVHFIGHSQGSTSFLAMGSDRPEYMKKIKLMQALAPVSFFDYVEGPVVTVTARYVRLITRTLKNLRIYELPPENETFSKVFYKLCTFLIPNTCAYFTFQMAGVDVDQISVTLAPLLAGHWPSGSSVKALMHYGQLVHSGGFYKYDYYNPDENRRRYGDSGAIQPPQYKLKNVDCKVALFYSRNDLLTAVKDVDRLSRILPNVVHKQLMAYEKFNHIDFVWGKDVKTMLYEDMIKLMQKVDRGEI